jgi:hypothetical protein
MWYGASGWRSDAPIPSMAWCRAVASSPAARAGRPWSAADPCPSRRCSGCRRLWRSGAMIPARSMGKGVPRPMTLYAASRWTTIWPPARLRSKAPAPWA